MARLLVTGGSGFLGRHLVPALRAQGHEVWSPLRRELDIVLGPWPETRFDHVVHLAALSSVVASWKDPSGFNRTNVLGTFNVLEYCRRQGASLTYVSAYVYGIPASLPLSESSPTTPSNPYALSKLMAEEACQFYATHFELVGTVLRPFNIYGPGQDASFVIPRIIEQALDPARAAIEVMDLAPRRDYVFVDDVVEAVRLTLDPPGFAIYNVGGGRSYSVEEVIGIVLAATGCQKAYRSTGERRQNEVLDVVADCAALNRACGWRPSVSFEEGIRRTVEEGRKR